MATTQACMAGSPTRPTTSAATAPSGSPTACKTSGSTWATRPSATGSRPHTHAAPAASSTSSAATSSADNRHASRSHDIVDIAPETALSRRENDSADSVETPRMSCSGNVGWAVVHPTSQAERWCAANLERVGYRVYLPLYAALVR